MKVIKLFMIIAMMLSTFVQAGDTSPVLGEEKLSTPKNSYQGQIFNPIYINKIAWLPNGQSLVVAASDSVLRYDANLASPPVVLAEISDSPYTTIAVTPDESFIAMGGMNHSEVFLWNTQTQSLEHTLVTDADHVTNLAFNENGSKLAISMENNFPDGLGTGNYRVQVWDVSSSQLIATLQKPGAGGFPSTPDLEFWPNDNSLIVAGRTFGFYEADSSIIQLWDIASGTIINQLHWQHILGGYILPTLRNPVVQGSTVVIAGLDEFTSAPGLQIWSMQTGELLRTIPVEQTDHITLALNRDATILAAANHKNTLRLWDIEQGTEIAILLENYAQDIGVMAFSPDGQSLVFSALDPITGENFVHLFDLGTGTEVAAVSLGDPDYCARSAPYPSDEWTVQFVDQGDVAGLIAAISAANANPDPDLIVLEHGTYPLTAPNNPLYGKNGLPVINTPIIIYGNCATIARDPAAEAFRLFYVTSAGNLTLYDLTLTGGDGGAIYSQGTVSATNTIIG